VVVDEPLKLELWNRRKALNGAQRLNDLNWGGGRGLGLVGEITYVGRTETERKPYQYRLTLRYVERTQQNPYGLVVSSVEQNEATRNP
jgi:hypothetical protein